MIGNKEYFLEHEDCIMTALYFENKEMYNRMSCGVIRGDGCSKEKCYAQYERIKAEMEVEE